MVFVWGLGLWNKGWSFMGFFVYEKGRPLFGFTV